jgi:hypothetical protein
MILHGFGDERDSRIRFRDGKLTFIVKDTTMSKFDLGQIVATPAALEAIKDSGQTPAFFLDKHSSADWGDLDAGDKALNDQAIVTGERLLSAYRTLKGVRLWIITEAKDDQGRRACSTLLLPQEY